MLEANNRREISYNRPEIKKSGDAAVRVVGKRCAAIDEDIVPRPALRRRDDETDVKKIYRGVRPRSARRGRADRPRLPSRRRATSPDARKRTAS